MDEQHDHSADSELELTDAIDNLLGEIETACADPNEPEPIDLSSDTLITDSGTAAAEPTPDPVGAESPEDSVDEDDSAEEPDAAQEALESIDAISDSAEDLLGDALDSILEEEQQDDEAQASVVEDTLKQDDPETAIDQSEADTTKDEPIVDAEEIPAESTADIETEMAPEAAVETESEQIEPDATDPDPAPVTDELESDDDAMLEDAVGDLLADSEDGTASDTDAEADTAETPASSKPEPTPEPEPASEPDLAAAAVDSGVMDQLDDALAGAADDLLEGDFETPEGELVEATTVDYTVDPELLLDEEATKEETPEPTDEQPESSTEASTSIEEPDLAQESTPSAEHTTATEPATADASQPEPKPEAAPEPAPQAEQPSADPPAEQPAPIADSAPASPSVPATEPAVEQATESAAEEPRISVFAKVAAAIEPLANRALTAIGPTGAKALLAASKPLASKSPEFRNAVGWVALWTMFLAIIVWGWALFFNTSSATTPTQAPTPIVSPEIEPGVTASHQP